MSFILPPAFRATDGDDNPLAGGQIRFFSGGTSTPRAVYSDSALATSLGTVVNLNAAGVPVSGANTPVLIYLGEGGTYKIEYYDSLGVLVPGMSFDLIPGAVAASAAVTSGLPTTPVVSKTSAYSVVVGDRGKLINANPTGGSFAITLPSAVTAGDDFRIGIRHNGTANTVTVTSVLSQSIRRHKNSTSWALKSLGETIWLVSDGADWTVDTYTPPLMDAATPFFKATDRLTAPPASPTAGARYIVNGTPTGAWSTLGFALHDVAEADGNGSWIKYTPSEGWFAYVEDENLFTAFVGTAWADQTGMAAAQSSNLQTAVFEHQETNGTVGGMATDAAWTKRTLNTSVQNDITGCSLATSQITLPVGKYLIQFDQHLLASDATPTVLAELDSRIKVMSGTATPDPIKGIAGENGTGLPGSAATTYQNTPFSARGVLTVTATAVIELQYFHNNAGVSTSELGVPSAESAAGTEVYARVTILSLASLQGATGAQGAQGAIGPVGNTGPTGPTSSTSFNFDSTTTDADPGSGDLRLNNATPASATAAYIDNNNRGAVDVSAWLDTFDDNGAAALRGQLMIFDAAAPTTVFRIYNVTGSVVDGTGYRKVTIAHVSGAGSFTNGNELLVSFLPRGPAGTSAGNIFTPEAYGAVGDGTTDDTTAFQSLATAVRTAVGAQIEFASNKTYAVFPSPSVGTNTLMNLTGCEGVRVNFNGSRFISAGTYTGGRITRVITLQNCYDIEINGFNAEQTTTLAADLNNGLAGIYIIDTNRDIRINGFYQKYGRSCLECVRASELSIDNRTRGIQAKGFTSDTVYYGWTLQKNGDNVEAFIRGINNARVVDAYNVRQLRAVVDSTPGANTLDDCMIGVYALSTETEYSNTTADINIHYSSRTQTAAPSRSFVAHFHAWTSAGHAGTSRNIDVTLDIEVPTAANTARAFELSKRDSAGAADTTTRSHILQNLTIRGVLKGFANNIDPIDLGNYGTWTGETIRNIHIGPLVTTGSGTGAITINTTAMVGVKFEKVRSAHDLDWTNDSGHVRFDQDCNFANLTAYPQLNQANAALYTMGQLILGGYALNVDLNAGSTDTAIAIRSPTTNYRVNAVFVRNKGTTASLTTATAGLFSAAAGAGLALAATQALSAITSNAIGTDANFLQMTATIAGRTAINNTTLYFRVGTAQGAAATGDVYVYIVPLP